MTVSQILLEATQNLKKRNIPAPALDAEILLSFVLKKGREYLFAHPEQKLLAYQTKKYQALIQRRSKLEPVAYLTGNQEFYGLNFYINRNVLIPRPETELIIEAVKKQIKRNESVIIVDTGTGSGCLAIALAKNFPQAQVFATDISQKALRVARKNAQLHKVGNRIKFYQGNLIEPLPRRIWLSGKKIIIVANLPYLNQEILASCPAIQYEPTLALYGGKDGLKLYHQFFKQLKFLVTGYKLQVTTLIEINPEQTQKIREIILNNFPPAKIRTKKDLQGLNRIIVIKIIPPSDI